MGMRYVRSICVVLLLSLLLAAGCQNASKQKSAPKQRAAVQSNAIPQTANDRLEKTGGCDERLQDIGGLFLAFSSMKHRLPESLDELRAMPGAASVGEFSCPVSNQPYAYDRNGIPVPSGAGRIILYDPAPSHGGMRLCLSITETGQGGALVTKVIALPEAFFRGR
jgi:hypothetical protein